MKIEFIAGKWISTKSIADRVVTAHFSVPASFVAKDFINRPLDLEMRPPHVEDTIMIDASMCTDPGSSYYYSPSHDTYAIKLDIMLPDLLLIGYILTSSLELYVQDNKI